MIPRKKTNISIIIACYNSEKILEEGVYKIKQFLDQTRYSYEIIFVDDKSQDATVAIINKVMRECGGNVHFISHEKNKGRGKTVHDGIKYAQGDIAGFIDIDLETPVYYILPLIIAINDGADIAIAKRIYKIDLTNPNTILRYILHRGYKTLSRLWLHIPVMDTETGCKFFKRASILPILDMTKDERWFWDTEIMVRSHYAGLKITEIPSLFIKRKDNQSTVRIFQDTKEYLVNLIQFRKESVVLKRRDKT